MRIVYPRCAGIDIHKDNMAVCLFLDRGDGSAPELLKRRYPTHTEGIRQLAGWLAEHRVTDVAMEATGVYWKPVWNALEGEFHLHLCNPQHVRALPGSKTDLRDGVRIAELLAYGQLPESFIPPRWQRELRDLTRLRTRYRQEAGQTGNRIQKVLEDAGIKLASVASDVLGVSGREMLRALVEGVQDPAQLAELAQGRLKAKKAELRRALEGDFREHHRFQLKLLLKSLQEAEEAIAQLDSRIAESTRCYAQQAQQLDEVPGFDTVSIAALLAEIGPDMQPWASAEKLASWCCICPGNRESGGKRLSGRTRKGNRWLRGVLCQTAWAATRKKGSYFRAQYYRLAGKRGKKRAILAVAHTQVRILYHLFSNPQLSYHELGEDYFDQRDAERTCRRLVHRLGKLGYEVTLTPKTAAA